MKKGLDMEKSEIQAALEEAEVSSFTSSFFVVWNIMIELNYRMSLGIKLLSVSGHSGA